MWGQGGSSLRKSTSCTNLISIIPAAMSKAGGALRTYNPSIPTVRQEVETGELPRTPASLEYTEQQ